MDSYKDVMLSEPPSRFTAAPSVHPVNLETYKGILLCDRPQAAAVRNDAPIPFLPSGKPEDRFIGIQPSNEQRARLKMIRNTNIAKNQTGNVVVAKHRRWLKSFAQTVKQAKMDQTEATLVSETRAAAYREKQATLRRQTRNTSSPPPSASGENESSNPNSLPPIKKNKASDKEKAKPKWAMTSAEAELAEDEEFLTQHDDLLRFAQDLDYNKFIDDLEVKEALAIMKERVEEIMAENGETDLTRDGGAARKPFVASKRPEYSEHDYGPSYANHARGWNNSTRVGDLSSSINEEALALADKILEGSESLRRVHTRVTLAKLLRDAVDAKKGIRSGEGGGLGEIAPSGSVQQPTIARIGADSTGLEAAPPQRRVLTEMRKATDKVQNLPYLYRCPAL